MRSGEARRLDCGDVDLQAATITIWPSKFDNYAEVVVMPSRAEFALSYAVLGWESSA